MAFRRRVQVEGELQRLAERVIVHDTRDAGRRAIDDHLRRGHGDKDDRHTREQFRAVAKCELQRRGRNRDHDVDMAPFVFLLDVIPQGDRRSFRREFL